MSLGIRFLFVAAVASPCLWDSDTLDTELRGLPEAFDLVSGRWYRHSDAYYDERVTRLGAKPELTLAEYDDLAVACEHLGRRDEAIAVMHRKEAALAKRPDADHEYRRLANEGTFLAHLGRYEEALPLLRAAVKLHPDAHFGRERYQIELIRYVIDAQQHPDLWQVRGFLEHSGYCLESMFHFMALDREEEDRHDVPEPLDTPCPMEWDEAYKAVAGMLRFGGREGPELYRALGELFLAEGHLNLAWWSFRRAIERGHPAADRLQQSLARIEAHWTDAERMLGPLNRTGVRAPTPAEYDAIRASADRWLAKFQELEAAAIARGEDVASDTALQALIAAADRFEPRPRLPRGWSAMELAILGIVSLLGLVALERWRVSRKRRVAGAAAAGGHG